MLTRKLKYYLIAHLLIFTSSMAVGGEKDDQNAKIDRHNIIDMDSPIVAMVGGISFRECTVTAGGRDRKVQCGWHEVPENPQAENDKLIKLFVVRIPAKRKSKNISDPVLFISGGPGQAASESYLFADYMWPSLAKNRDFYLIDQRGTGYSNFMGCEDILNNETMAEHTYDSEVIKQLTAKCLDSMPGDVRFYTTDISVDDFESVRKNLEIKKWNLLGVSYGTRVSTHYMRKYPSSLRTVVLDSVLPPQHILGTEIAFRSQNILDVLYKRCESDSACNELMPNLKREVTTLFEKLEKASVKIKVENFRTGAIEDVTFSRDDLVLLVRLYLYSSNSMAVLPPMLHEASVNGNYSPLARAATSAIKSMSRSISTGLHNSVMCTEEFPYYALSEDQKKENLNSYMGLDLVQLMEDICSVWPRGETIASMKEPLVSDIPTLLVSGEFDPITPPDYAEQTAKQLSNAKHLVIKGQGHFVSSIGCMPDLVDRFVNDMSANALNTSCLDRISAAPLFINFNGSAP